MRTNDATGGSPPVVRGFVVRGRVQGVGFRWWTHRRAEALGIDGTVENLGDGSVRVMARGSGEAIDALRTDLGQGPPLSRVDAIETVECVLDAGHRGFEILR